MRFAEKLERWTEHGPFPAPLCKRSSDAEERLAPRRVLVFGTLATFATFLMAWVGFVVLENRFPESPISIWKRWDALHYLTIAESGYGTDAAREILAIWPPLYSWCIRLVAPLVGGHHVAGILLSFVFFLGLLWALYRLVALDYPERVAARTVVYLSVFPTAYFLHAAYSESLFAMLVASSFLFARRGNWAVAGLLAGLSAMTRVTWVALFPALMIEYAIQKGFRWREVRWDLAYLLFVPLGFSVFLWINHQIYGDPFHFMDAQRSIMKKHLAMPWVGFDSIWAHAHGNGPSRYLTIGVFETIAVVGGFVIVVVSALRMRSSYAVFIALGWCQMAFTNWWLGALRYWLPLFPAFLVLSLWGERRAVNAAYCLLATMTYMLLLVLFVRGSWTY